jgi:glycosyltransferase involved in cell wall biosynthesis
MIKLAVVGLYIGHGSLGGVSNYTKLLLNHINRDDFDVYYYSLGKSPNWYKGEDKPSLLEFGIKSVKKMLFFFYFLKKNRIEVVHLNSGLTQISLFREGLLSLIAKLVGCNTLFFIHGWKEKEFDKLLKSKIKKKLSINILNKQDKIFVLAEQFKRKLIDLGIENEKIFVTSMLVEANKYFPHDKKFLRPYKILICANMIKEKGIFELLEAAPKVLEKFPDSKFIFMGEGKDLENLKQKTKKMNVEKNIVFTGHLIGEEKIKIFKNSHIFVIPSYTEGFPTVVLEALAAGAALIFTPVGGLVNTMVDGRNGFLIKSIPPDPDDIAEKVIHLLENPRLMIKISEDNIMEAKEKFDADILSRDIGKIYRQIIS